MKSKISSTRYLKVAQAIRFLSEHHTEQPSLKTVATEVGLSEFHFQRLFTQWAGVSPKQFLQYLTKEHAKKKLAQSPVLDTALSVGLSSSSRLYDLMITLEKVTPGEYRSGGSGLSIEFGTHHSPFGSCFIARTPRGVCKLSFYDNKDEVAAVTAELESAWPNAELIENQTAAQTLIEKIFSPTSGPASELKLHLMGTEFQTTVWEALLKIPAADLQSYQTVADEIGKPAAVRAVASAIGKNQIAYLIPCHRVIRATGVFNQYRWGATRKAALIGWESAQVDGSKQP